MNEPTRETLRQAARMILDSRWSFALTGAGISVDSGIPDFRSMGGLWTRFDPMEYATIEAFYRNRAKVWEMIREMSALINEARPNPGHIGLADLEKMDLLKAIVTQNVDNLHQEAGSREVIEFHGNGNQLVCTTCSGRFTALEAEQRAIKTGDWPPDCPSCAEILKPDVVFFGEAIPARALEKAQIHASEADLILVLGSSATVMPAAHLPMITKQRGGKIIELNKAETQLTPMADLTVLGGLSQTVPRLLEQVRALRDERNG